MEEKLQQQIILVSRKIFGDCSERIDIKEDELKGWIAYDINLFAASLQISCQKQDAIVSCCIGFAATIDDNFFIDIKNFYVQEETGRILKNIPIYTELPKSATEFRIIILQTLSTALEEIFKTNTQKL